MKIAKPILFYSAQILICILLLEIISYFFLQYSGNPLYRARRILQYDEQLGWFQKPELDTDFEKKKVYTDHAGFRIDSVSNEKQNILLMLGPSSAFGWGVNYNETYSFLTADHLKSQLLNASGIGHSIIQGQLVWENKISNLNLPIKHAIISYGVNDIDKFRFFDSNPVDDIDYFHSTPDALKLDKMLLPSNSLIVASLVIRQYSYTKKCDQLIHPVQRVGWSRFEKTLEVLIKELHSRNIKPVLVNTPFFLKSRNPEYSKELIDQTYNEVSKLAVIGKCKEAHEKLKLAKSYEPDHILEAVVGFNKSLKNFAEKNNLKYIDAFQILSDSQQAENFVDPVHPSASGHQKIAGQLIKSMLY